MPRRRQQTVKLPNGIKPDALPAYVYWKTAGNGRWVYQYIDPATKRQTTRRIASANATLREIWNAYEDIVRKPPTKTIASLIAQFSESREYAELAAKTKTDYDYCARNICATTTKKGVFTGDIALNELTPGTVRQYVDMRDKTSRSCANHELRYLRRLFSWACERDIMPTNPARGVKTLKEVPRQRYVTDDEYTAFMEYAGNRFLYLVSIAELAYLCRLRISEVCDLRRDDIRDDGLFAARRKGSKDALTQWTPRLRAAVEHALSLHGGIASAYVITSTSGGRMAESSVQTAWQRAMVEWEKMGNARFTFHDLKRKGVSDVSGDKLAASGHRSAAMLRVYDVLPATAPATR